MNNFIERITRKEYEELKIRSDIQIILIKGEDMNSENDVFNAFHDQTGVEYMSRNWNSLDEVLRDCYWMKKDILFLIHDKMPKIAKEEEMIYESILQTALETHQQGPIPGCILPQRKIDFHVALIDG